MEDSAATAHIEVEAGEHIFVLPGSSSARRRPLFWCACLICCFGGALIAIALPLAAKLAVAVVPSVAAVLLYPWGPRLFATRIRVTPEGTLRISGAFGRVLHESPVSDDTLELRHDSRFWFSWGREATFVSEQAYRTLARLGVPENVRAYPPKEQAASGSATWLYVGGVLAAITLPLLGLSSLQSQRQRSTAVRAPEVEGSFASTASLGSWERRPAACLSGRERGFRGILFQFAEGIQVKEIRLDTERMGDNILEVIFFDVQKPSVRIRERECERIDGRTEITNMEVNGRDMQQLRGQLQIECSAFGLRGSVSYDGCLPNLPQ